MRASFHRSVPPRIVALLLAAALAAVPAAARADTSEGPGEARRAIEALDAAIARAQEQVERRSGASSRATWLLFKARRKLDIARLARRDDRVWGIAPDEMRLSQLGATPQEYAVAKARARYRTLSSSDRIGGAASREEALRAHLVSLEADRAQWMEALADPGGAGPRTWGARTPDAGQWARAFLAKIGAPACEENRVLVVAWQAQESTEARFNPLATTHWMPGARDFNSVGVKNYRSVGQGLDASRETLEDGAPSYGYEAVLSSLRACHDAEATAWFVNASAWCRACTAGAYLTGMLPAVRADYPAYAAR